VESVINVNEQSYY